MKKVLACQRQSECSMEWGTKWPWGLAAQTLKKKRIIETFACLSVQKPLGFKALIHIMVVCIDCEVKYTWLY